MAFSVFFRRHACMFFKLPAEMLGAWIAALWRYLVNGVLRIAKKLLCHNNAVVNNVWHAWEPELLPVQLLKMSWRYIKKLCHRSNAPRGSRISLYIHSKLLQRYVKQVILCSLHWFVKFEQKNLKQILEWYFLIFIVKKIFAGNLLL